MDSIAGRSPTSSIGSSSDVESNSDDESVDRRSHQSARINLTAGRSGSYLPGHQAQPANLDNISRFSCWRAIAFTGGLLIAAFGVAVAASGLFAFGGGIAVTGPIGGCICVAGLSMMGLTVHKHNTDKKFAALEQNLRRDLAELKAGYFHQTGVIRRLQDYEHGKLRRDVDFISTRLAEFEQGYAKFAQHTLDDFEPTTNYNISQLGNHVKIMSDVIRRLQHSNSISQSIMSPVSVSQISSPTALAMSAPLYRAPELETIDVPGSTVSTASPSTDLESTESPVR